jgi:hypothetical protein
MKNLQSAHWTCIAPMGALSAESRTIASESVPKELKYLLQLTKYRQNPTHCNLISGHTA